MPNQALPADVIDHIAALMANLSFEGNKGIRWDVCGPSAKDHYRALADRAIRDTAAHLKTKLPRTIAGALAQRLKATVQRTDKREDAVRMASAAKTLNAEADRLEVILFPKEPAETSAAGKAA